MMYLLFRYKSWSPSEYFDMLESDKRIVRLFMAREIVERNKEIEEMKKG
ncbi:hypothetical protein [Lacrimispora amygdalina]|nr:hypothetical protein [Clostridium indicum]